MQSSWISIKSHFFGCELLDGWVETDSWDPWNIVISFFIFNNIREFGNNFFVLGNSTRERFDFLVKWTDRRRRLKINVRLTLNFLNFRKFESVSTLRFPKIFVWNHRPSRWTVAYLFVNTNKTPKHNWKSYFQMEPLNR